MTDPAPTLAVAFVAALAWALIATYWALRLQNERNQARDVGDDLAKVVSAWRARDNSEPRRPGEPPRGVRNK